MELSFIPKENLAQQAFRISSSTLRTTFETLLTLFSLLSYLVLLPLYTFFLLRGLNQIWDTFQNYLPTSRKGGMVRVFSRMHRAVSSFFRGKLIICLVKGLLTWLCLQILGVKFALIFGAVQFIASIIPFLVLAVGMLPNLVLVLLDAGIHWPLLIGVVCVYFLMEGLEGFFLTPWIMGKETGLHPMTVILALLIGGKLWGLFGLLIGVPLATTLKILAEELILPHLREVLIGDGHDQESPEDSVPF